ncbi:unnamed protein product [Protopolystoma xenopodis]|uniref:Uncharacterized protein n=1 Tax=Protopolystoma xenopodis TaxID=117903 RepID=A0A448X815_9PLAT|nr:unnamed protein product [Protopolystoma xenopodis]
MGEYVNPVAALAFWIIGISAIPGITSLHRLFHPTISASFTARLRSQDRLSDTKLSASYMEGPALARNSRSGHRLTIRLAHRLSCLPTLASSEAYRTPSTSIYLRLL